MPWFVIASLIISTATVGLIFNIDFKFLPLLSGDTPRISIELPGAKADTATTTVRVRNAPPYITVGPAESPASATNTPVNYGEAISFNATAQDDESNQYYLIICTANSVTASTTGGAPTCGGIQLCLSGLANSGAVNSCTYGPVDLVAETQVWYAFVCDNHATEGECSPATNNQGSGDSGSPFFINHAPTVQAVSATVNFQAPGGTFTFTATSTDSDNARGGDEIRLHICDDGGWATSTGCVNYTYCTSTWVQAVGNQAVNSCNWTDTAPTPDMAYTVYAYIEDEFYLGGTNNGTTTTYTIINVAPEVQGVYLVPNDGNEIQLNIKDAPATMVIASSTNVSDQNGCADLVAATSTIYWSSVSGGYNCAANDNNCYKIGSANCVIGNCVGAVAEVTCTTTIEYHAIPTDASSFYAAATWLASISVRDEALFGVGTTSLPGTDLKTSQAMEVTESEIDYGVLVAGQNTGTDNATTTILNFGNCPIDADISGTWMSDGGVNHFSESQQEFSTTTNFMWNGGDGQSLSSTTPFTLDVDIARPISTSTDMLDLVYWGIGIPVLQMSGVYSGTNTFEVAIDPDGAW